MAGYYKVYSYAMAQAEMAAQHEYHSDEEYDFSSTYESLSSQERQDRRLAQWSADYNRRNRWLETTVTEVQPQPDTFDSWFSSIAWNDEDGDPRDMWDSMKRAETMDDPSGFNLPR